MRKKTIEVQVGYVSKGELGHFQIENKFGQRALICPIVYCECPNPDNFRKVKITVKEE